MITQANNLMGSAFEANLQSDLAISIQSPIVFEANCP
jgi:hypothetical protein